jgi:nicotinamide-nucleotide amidase
MPSATTDHAADRAGDESTDDASTDPLAALVASLVGDRRVGTAESCTAGRIGTALATVPGAAEWFAGSIVAYQESVKRHLLGVRAPSVYSEQAVAEMATGACRSLGVDAAVATSGVAGGEPEDGVEPGTVFVGVSVSGHTSAARYELDGDPDEVVEHTRDLALRDLAVALR